MRKPLAALLGSGLLLVAGAASAQQYGYSGSYSPGMPPPSASGVDNIGIGGQLVLGVERITGIFMQSDKGSAPDGTGGTVDASRKDTTLGLLGMQGVTPSSVPRVAFDYFVIDSFSVGGSLMYWSDAPSTDVNGTSTDGTASHAFMLNPRVGYAYVIDDTFAIWPRGGLMYAHSSAGDNSSSRIDLTLDAMLGISPVKHVVFLVGPLVDIGVGGSEDVPDGTGGTMSNDVKLTTFGLSAGLAAYMP